MDPHQIEYELRRLRSENDLLRFQLAQVKDAAMDSATWAARWKDMVMSMGGLLRILQVRTGNLCAWCNAPVEEHKDDCLAKDTLDAYDSLVLEHDLRERGG